MNHLQVAEILKDRPSWFRDCRCLEVLNVIPTGNGGTIELVYMQVGSSLRFLAVVPRRILVFSVPDYLYTSG